MSAPARPILRSSILAAGAGAPVLLLHGSVSSAAMWTPVIDALKSRFRVLAPDLIGYGRTDPWPAGHDYSLDDEVRLIVPLVMNQPEGVHVVAHSYGGAVALQLARSGGVVLRSLTLIEPVAFYALREAGEPQAWSAAEAFRRAYVERIAAGETEAAMRAFVDYWSLGGTWDAMDEAARAQMRRATAKIVLDFQAAFADPGPDPFRDIRLPVHLIAGDRSPEPAQRVAAVLARSLPSASLQVVSGANHLLPATHHRLLSELLLAKLEV
jgi:pimeloyl-ACP methyl ester carboxylesterase